MSKRFPNLCINQVASKKPKLDITIISSQSSKVQTTKIQQNKFQHHVPQKAQIEDIWGDDDDEFIMLASQAAQQVETQSQLITQQSPERPSNISNFDITFGRFSKGVQSSTQLITEKNDIDSNGLKELLQVDDDILTELTSFGDDSFGIESNSVDKCKNEYLRNQRTLFDTRQPENREKELFKQPVIQNAFRDHNQPSTSVAKTKKTSPEKQTSPPNNLQQTLSDNRNHAKDLQVNFLVNKLDVYRQENDKLKHNYSEILSKCQTKEGEVATLRYELNHVKQLNNNLRIEKIQENENQKKEWMDKIRELEKIVKSQQSELEFKNLEIVNIKSRKHNDTIKINESVENDLKDLKKDLQKIQSVFYLQIPAVRFINKLSNHNAEMKYKIFENSDKLSTPTKKIKLHHNSRDFLLSENLRNLQGALSEMRSIGAADSKQLKELSHTIHVNAINSIYEIRKYVNQLKYTQYTDSHSNPGMEYSFLSENSNIEFFSRDLDSKNKVKSVYHFEKMYETEMACTARRILAAISMACKDFPIICDLLLNENNGNNMDGMEIDDDIVLPHSPTFIQVLIEVLNRIGYAKELYNHMGFITTASIFANSLTEYCTNNPNELKSLSLLLKSIVFCRPEAIVLIEISQFLYKLSSSERNLQFINSMCHSSSSNCFVFNKAYNIMQFSPNSCILQIYASLLEVAVKQYIDLDVYQLNVLYRLTLNTIRLFHNCFKFGARWLVEESPDNESCDCYNKLATSFLILFHLCLKHWISNPQKNCKSQISSISQKGVLLLFDIIHINYRKSVLQIGGYPIKHRLQLIYNWLNQNKDIFQFRLCHKFALQSIDLRLIIADPLEQAEGNKEKLVEENNNQIWDNIFDFFLDL